MSAVILLVITHLMATASGCAEPPELGTGVYTYSEDEAGARLRVMDVDEELSRRVQSGALSVDDLPANKLYFYEYERDAAGNIITGADGEKAGTAWVVNDTPFFTQLDLFYVEVFPAAGGTFDVVYRLQDRNISLLQQATTQLADRSRSSEPQLLAVIYNEEVRSVEPVTEPISNGEVRVTGLTEQEAIEISKEFPDPSFYSSGGEGATQPQQ